MQTEYTNKNLSLPCVKTYLNNIAAAVSRTVEKILHIALIIIKGLVDILTFPFRYLGAKTWSIPGLILRTPVILFKHIFFQEPLTQAQFFGTGYHTGAGPQLSKDETKNLMRYAALGLVPFRYETDKWAEPYGATLLSPEALNIDLTKIPGDLKAEEKCFIDRNNLFKSLVFEDENELVVTFGAMHSHWHDFSDSNEATRQYHKQLVAVTANYAGTVPLYYKQADALIEQLKKVAQQKNKRLVVTGQSLAGSIASYVSLKHEVQGVCFNSVQLGAGAQHAIGEKKLANADHYLTHVTVENELLNAFPGMGIMDRTLSALGVRTPGNFGKRFHIPSAFDSMRDAHDYPIQSIMQYIGYEKDKKVCDLKHTDIIKSKKAQN